MSEKFLEENRAIFAKRVAFLSTLVPSFTTDSHGDTTELKVDMPTHTFNQLILGPETLTSGADSIAALLPKETEYALWSWGKKINGIGAITEMSAMLLHPDPWAPDPKSGDGSVLLANKPEHFKVAGEVIARTMPKGEAAAIRRIFPTMKAPQGAQASKLKRLLYTVENRAVGTIGLFQDEDQGLIFDFAVQPDFQGKGYGAILLGIVIREFMNSGCWNIHLQAVSGATDLYQSFGFKTVGRVFETIGNTKKSNATSQHPDPAHASKQPETA